MILSSGEFEALMAMVRYIYGFGMHVNDTDLEWAFHLFEVASEYEVPGLLKYSVEGVREVLGTHLCCLDTCCSDKIDFLDLIYSGVPRYGGELVREAETACREFIESLMHREDFVDFLERTPELAVKLLKLVVEEGKAETRKKTKGRPAGWSPRS